MVTVAAVGLGLNPRLYYSLGRGWYGSIRLPGNFRIRAQALAVLTLLGYAALALALFWVVHDPTGAADTVAYIAHALGVMASTLTQHLSAGGRP